MANNQWYITGMFDLASHRTELTSTSLILNWSFFIDKKTRAPPACTHPLIGAGISVVHTVSGRIPRNIHESIHKFLRVEMPADSEFSFDPMTDKKHLVWECEIACECAYHMYIYHKAKLESATSLVLFTETKADRRQARQLRLKQQFSSLQYHTHWQLSIPVQSCAAG